MGVFSTCVIALDLTTSVSFKKKIEIKKKVIDNGGVVSFIVTRKTTHVVGNDPDKFDVSSKCRMAVKYGIPVVSPDFLSDAIESGKLPNTDGYIIGGRSKTSDFKSGKISAVKLKSEVKKRKVQSIFSIKGIKVWQYGDNKAPFFDEENYEIAKYAVFEGYDKKRESKTFYAVEIHVNDKKDKNTEDEEHRFRVFTHHGTIDDVQDGSMCTRECRYVKTADEALALFANIHKEQTQPIKKQKDVTGRRVSRNIGSHKLQKILAELPSTSSDLDPHVADLVKHIWREVAGEISDILAVPVASVKVEQVEKAEAVLMEMQKCLTSDLKEKLVLLQLDFYEALPHKKKDTEINKQWVATKLDLCQLIRDMVSVSEATSWSTQSSVEAKYRALRCNVNYQGSHDQQYKMVADLVQSSLEGGVNMEIQTIFEVQRPIEETNFRHDIEPKQLLFHASKTENFVGILSRGLLMPKMVVEEFGGKRTDAGMLGSGLYFASAASTSAKYSSASRTKGTRLMLVSEVALGRCKELYSYDTTLKRAPEGFDSVHGVKSSEKEPSDFKEDEFAIYNVNQQRLRYLVEFTLAGDVTSEISQTDIEMETEEESLSNRLADNLDLSDVQNVEDPLLKVKAGLVADSNKTAVELQGVHIRAKLVDLAAQVIVLQEYYNNSDSHIEAKYVFPLDDMAAVCGFEAFINGKHIVGEVKEKEQAHKEYKQAVKEGHGAYLMDRDEETPDVFTVSVGNLPPGACVLIKITYVAELQVEAELISFRLPGSVAPWKQDSAAKDITQTELETHKVKGEETTVQVAVEMPFDIHSIQCPSHQVRIKRTASKAVVEMKHGQSIEDGFHLLIGLAEIHVPRMWVEKHPEKDVHQACMLTFYPEFEADEEEEVEVVFVLDLSNSMAGDAALDAKKILMMCINNLPKKSVFNVVCFGTSTREVFPCSQPKTNISVQAVEKFLKTAWPDMGNTEVFKPLHTYHLLASERSTRNIFLISDGHFNNEETVLNSIINNANNTRVFTLGVSATSNMHLLRGVARVGGGAFEFFDRKAKSKWERKVKSQLSKASQPGLTSVCVEWQQFDSDPDSLPQAPRQITALFSGSRQVVYGFVPNCTMASLKAVIGGQEVSTVVSTSDLNITTGELVHRLTARALIRDWEDGMLSSERTQHEILKRNLKNYVIELSKEYSLVTQFTSFVAIETRDEDEKKGLKEKTGPSMSELVGDHSMDILSYMGWEKVKGEDGFEDEDDFEDGDYSEDWDDFEEEELTNIPLKRLRTERKIETALSIGKKAFDDSVGTLDSLSEDSYKDSTLDRQTLRDRLNVIFESKDNCFADFGGFDEDEDLSADSELENEEMELQEEKDSCLKKKEEQADDDLYDDAIDLSSESSIEWVPEFFSRGEKTNFRGPIHQVLKQVHPHTGINLEAMNLMNQFVGDMFGRLASEASAITKQKQQTVLTEKEIGEAVKSLLPGELAKHAISEGVKSTTKYTSSTDGISSIMEMYSKATEIRRRISRSRERKPVTAEEERMDSEASDDDVEFGLFDHCAPPLSERGRRSRSIERKQPLEAGREEMAHGSFGSGSFDDESESSDEDMAFGLFNDGAPPLPTISTKTKPITGGEAFAEENQSKPPRPPPLTDKGPSPLPAPLPAMQQQHPPPPPPLRPREKLPPAPPLSPRTPVSMAPTGRLLSVRSTSNMAASDGWRSAGTLEKADERRSIAPLAKSDEWQSTAPLPTSDERRSITSLPTSDRQQSAVTKAISVPRRSEVHLATRGRGGSTTSTRSSMLQSIRAGSILKKSAGTERSLAANAKDLSKKQSKAETEELLEDLHGEGYVTPARYRPGKKGAEFFDEPEEMMQGNLASDVFGFQSIGGMITLGSAIPNSGAPAQPTATHQTGFGFFASTSQPSSVVHHDSLQPVPPQASLNTSFGGFGSTATPPPLPQAQGLQQAALGGFFSAPPPPPPPQPQQLQQAGFGGFGSAPPPPPPPQPQQLQQAGFGGFGSTPPPPPPPQPQQLQQAGFGSAPPPPPPPQPQQLQQAGFGGFGSTPPPLPQEGLTRCAYSSTPTAKFSTGSTSQQEIQQANFGRLGSIPPPQTKEQQKGFGPFGSGQLPIGNVSFGSAPTPASGLFGSAPMTASDGFDLTASIPAKPSGGFGMATISQPRGFTYECPSTPSPKVDNAVECLAKAKPIERKFPQELSINRAEASTSVSWRADWSGGSVTSQLLGEKVKKKKTKQEAPKSFMQPAKLVLGGKQICLDEETAIFDPKTRSMQAADIAKPSEKSRKAVFATRFKEMHKLAEEKDSLSDGRRLGDGQAVMEFGIGVSVPCVRGRKILTLDKMMDLLKLQKDGFWEFGDDLDMALGIQSNLCIQLLYKAGLRSLGCSVSRQILHLLATFLALLSILEVMCPELLPLSMTQIGKLVEGSSSERIDIQNKHLRTKKRDVVFIFEALSNGYRFCHQIDQNHPLVCSNLELGANWIVLSSQLLGMSY